MYIYKKKGVDGGGGSQTQFGIVVANKTYK